MTNPTKPKWHDLLVFENGAHLGSVKELIARNPERGRQWLYDCLLALKNLRACRLVFVPPADARRWRALAGEELRIGGEVDWEGFEWHLTTDDMKNAASAVLALAIEGRDAETAQAVWQAIRCLAEIYQTARGSAVYAELSQIASALYIPRADVTGDQAADWQGRVVRAHLTEVGRLRFTDGVSGRLSLTAQGELAGVVIGQQELADEELHGLVRMAGEPT
jgi:cytochrome c5